MLYCCVIHMKATTMCCIYIIEMAVAVGDRSHSNVSREINLKAFNSYVIHFSLTLNFNAIYVIGKKIYLLSLEATL